MKIRSLELSKSNRAMSHARPEQDSFLRELAGGLAKRGLREPALSLLAAGRPLTFLLGQLLWVAQPVAALLWPRSQITTLAQLLEDERAVTQLQRYLNAEEQDE